MDLRPVAATPTSAEREAVDALLGPAPNRWEGGERSDDVDGRVAEGGAAARARRHLLLPALWAVQDAIGWISEGALGYVCQRLTVPPADAYEVATFYALLATEPRPPQVMHVCDDIVCKTAGADELVAALEARYGPPGTPADGGQHTWLTSPCLGQCERAPACYLQRAGDADATLAPADTSSVEAAFAGEVSEQASAGLPPQVAEARATGNGQRAGDGHRPGDGQAALPALRTLRRVGAHDPERLDAYRAVGGYRALRRAVALGAAGVLAEVADSKLLGRGGAAFPTAVKWQAVAQAPERPHYLICNADESEPGTFKDRVLMESDPFAVIEAMTVAGYATGSEIGYLYIRGEYPLAQARLESAISQARARGLLGADVLGKGFAFDIELRRGAGAYICGEETALMNSIEGHRGEPRNKPPFPTQRGLFDKPTAVNNVETLVNVLDVLGTGGPAFADTGTAQSTGTKLFCVSGGARTPGLYEVAFGMTLGELLELAGGLRAGRELQAVLLGGAAGTFVDPGRLDVPLTFEGTREIGAALGSGAVIVFDDTADLPASLVRIAAFFRDESCGQCVPCRIGTVRQEEALARLVRGEPHESREGEIALLGELEQALRDASICGLGHTAGNAVRSALALGLLDDEGVEHERLK